MCVHECIHSREEHKQTQPTPSTAPPEEEQGFGRGAAKADYLYDFIFNNKKAWQSKPAAQKILPSVHRLL